MDDFATAFTAINQADVQTRVSYAVARKVLETEQAAGSALVKLIESAGRAQLEAARAIGGLGGFAGVGEQLDAQG